MNSMDKVQLRKSLVVLAIKALVLGCVHMVNGQSESRVNPAVYIKPLVMFVSLSLSLVYMHIYMQGYCLLLPPRQWRLGKLFTSTAMLLVLQ